VESLVNNEVNFALVSILPTTVKNWKDGLLQNKLFLVSDKKTNSKGVNITVFKDLPLIFLEKRLGYKTNYGKLYWA
jgi:hypothetical protein